MQTFKLGSFEDYKKGAKYPAVYVFRSGRKIYYVGATKDFGGRMKQHIRNTERYASQPIAVAMQNSRGAWRNWDVNVYGIEDCEATFGCILISETVFIAEAKMMVKLRPRLNVAWPQDYADRGLEGASAMALDAWRCGDRAFAQDHAKMHLRTYLQDNAAERIKLAQRTFVNGD